jgi:hypothetical protein
MAESRFPSRAHPAISRRLAPGSNGTDQQIGTSNNVSVGLSRHGGSPADG